MCSSGVRSCKWSFKEGYNPDSQLCMLDLPDLPDDGDVVFLPDGFGGLGGVAGRGGGGRGGDPPCAFLGLGFLLVWMSKVVFNA